MKKNVFKRVTAMGATAMLVFSFGACGGETANVDGYAYLAVDINPTVEFVLLDGKVSSVNAVNDDAAVLINGVDFTNMTAEEVTEKVVELAQEMGYLNADNTGVKISVAAGDEDTESKLQDWAMKGAKKLGDWVKVNANPRNEDERTLKKLKEEDEEKYKHLDAVKVRLIEAVMQFDETMTHEIGATMSVEDLADLLEDYMEEYKEYAGETLKKEYKADLKEKREEIERQVAEIYGAEYLSAWEEYTALEKAYKAIEFVANKINISAEDLQTLQTLLNKGEDWFASGEVVLEDIDEYMDKVFDNIQYTFEGVGNMFESAKEYFEQQMDVIEEQIETLLEKYDEDNYVLTAEQIASIQSICQDFVAEGDVSFEDLEDFIEAKKEALKTLKESIQLTEEQKAQISALKDGFKDMKEDLHEDWKEHVDSVKEYYEDWRDFRKEHKHDGEDFKAPQRPVQDGEQPLPPDAEKDSAV